MGNIYATNYLTEVANLVPQFTILAMGFQLIIGRRHSLGWMIGPTAIIMYNNLVRIPWNIQNPLELYVGEDEVQATVILYFILGIFCFGYSYVADGLLKVLRIKELFPFSKALGHITRKNADPLNVVMNRKTGNVTLEELEYNDGTGTSAYTNGNGKVPPYNGRPSWVHLIATFCYFAAYAASIISWDQLMLITGDEGIALGVLIADPPVVSLLYLAFCFAWTDPAIFGHTKASLAEHRETQSLSEKEVDFIVKKTHYAILWAVVPIVLCLLIGNTWLGLTRYYNADVDVNWLSALGLWAFFLLLLVVCYFATKSQYNKMLTKPKPSLPDGGSFYDDVAKVRGDEDGEEEDGRRSMRLNNTHNDDLFQLNSSHLSSYNKAKTT